MLANNLNQVPRLSFICTSHYIVKGQYALSFVYRLLCPAGLLYNATARIFLTTVNPATCEDDVIRLEGVGLRRGVGIPEMRDPIEVIFTKRTMVTHEHEPYNFLHFLDV
jgi:hypothetical protein